jgi:hypothetical protein
MSYGNKTDIFQIDSIKAGEFVSESAEESAANKIENALIGAISMHSGGHGVFRLGDFTTAGDSGGFTINLSPNGSTPAAQGFIRFAHFRVSTTIQWVIAGDAVHQLFIQKVEDGVSSTLEHGDVTVGSTTTGSIPDDALLIAEATVAGNTITLDSSPSARLDIDSITTHIAQNTNPHTDHLVQSNMFISGLTANTVDTQTITVLGDFNNSGTSTFTGRATFDQDVHITQDMLLSGLGLFVGDSILAGS